VLAIHLSANVEKTTAGFTLSPADQDTLAAGARVILSNGGGDTIEIELVTDFPDYVPEPLPGAPTIVRGSNPFGLVAVGDQLYVTDGGRNLVWQVDIASGQHAVLASFPTIPNPLPIGGPMVEAVPTGIEYADGKLLVTLFRGVPFPPVLSTIVQIDPATGAQAPLITGLKTAIGVMRTFERGDDDYLVLQHSSGMGPFFGGPGQVLRVEAPGASAVVLADCLARPTAMLLDKKSATLFVTEMVTGRIVALALE
jgi:sugar lactone lactonase YvrE